MKKIYIVAVLLFYDINSLKAQPKRNPIVDTIITICGRETYISYPIDIKEKYPVVMAIHGSGRGALSYDPNSKLSSPFYIHQRNLAVDHGFMFVVISNGADTWGTDEGLKRLDSLYNYIYDKYNVKKRWILWATSAGGVLLARFIKDNPDKVCKALGTFPVYNLRYEYFHLKSAHSAWGTDTTEMNRINPINYPQAFTNIPYLIFHGRNDTAVPVKINSIRLEKEVNNIGGHVMLHIVPGGHSTHNWHVYDDKVIIRFLLNKCPYRKS
ncbi:MAG: hypothetical protein EPN39_13100 [Chitinophagaceae bacterium]|nr:MAG: hypothetical protein EPN39_13100 [Chitinophagaceae bacterium]